MSDFHRTNIQLYRRDYEYLLARYGYGWTSHIRDIVHREVVKMREETAKAKSLTFTVEDLK